MCWRIWSLGRPLTHIATDPSYDGLAADVAAVLESLSPTEREVATRAGRQYLLRIAPYRLHRDRVDGVVLTLVDITERERQKMAVRQAEERFRHVSESGLLSIAFFTADGEITEANNAFLTTFGFTRDDLLAGRISWGSVTPPDWNARTALALREFEETGRIAPYQKEYLRRDGGRFWGLLGAARLEGSNEGVAFVIDLTARARPPQPTDH